MIYSLVYRVAATVKEIILLWKGNDFYSLLPEFNTFKFDYLFI